jgi:hypothetical protein
VKGDNMEKILNVGCKKAMDDICNKPDNIFA